MTNSVVEQRSIAEIMQEYHEKIDAVPDIIKEYEDFTDSLETKTRVGGTYVYHDVGISGKLYEREIKKRLLLSAWQHIYDGLFIDDIIPANDRKSLKLKLADPPEFTRENIRDVLGDYWLTPRYHVLRGLAEAFCELDPAYRSHSRVKIGVKGLPKRVIVNNAFGSESWSTWGYGQNYLKDMINALSVYRDQPRLDHKDWHEMEVESKKNGEAKWFGGRIKRYGNGNAHLYFDAEALKDVNRGLAEFYGDVLPDSPEAAQDVQKKTSTAVSKDLAYFWTEQSVVRRMIERGGVYDGNRILEPSCGDGRILDGLSAYAKEQKINISLTGIEYDHGRAHEAKSKGYNVVRDNFLEYPSTGDYDLVYMNPPFAGKHYLKHIEKAIGMLKEGGRIVAILPASAWYDHEGLPGREYDPKNPYSGRDSWTDLPTGSFRNAGTNVQTGIWTYFK